MDTEAIIKQDETTPSSKSTDGATQTPINTEVNKEKTFTQFELNDIIAGRIAKMKEQYVGYDDYKTKAGELITLTEKYNDLDKKYQVNSNTLQAVYDGIVENLEDDKKNLIPEQLTLSEKISYIGKNKAIFSATIPTINIPEAEENPKAEGGLFGGKYKTLDEWSIADPSAYIAYRRNNL